MNRALHAEWIKLSTITAHKILVAIAVLFPTVVGTLVATFGAVDTGPDSAEMADFVLGMSVVSTMLLGVVAVIGLTSEYTHNTIRPTYAATPSRARVLIAKLIVSATLTFVTAVVVVFGTWAITAGIFNARGGEVSLGDDTVMTVLICAIVLAVLVTCFGFGLGLIIRNSPATVSIVLLWPLLIETLLLVVVNLIGWEGASKYVPYQAAIVASNSDPGGDALGRPGGQLLFAAVAAALIVLGIVLDERRDA